MFASLASFDSNQVSTASLNGALPINGLRKTQYYGYLQDEFRVTPELNLNLGVRYSFFNIFHEVEGRANPFDFATCGSRGFCGVGASFGQPNYGDIDPRLAFSWSPYKSGRSVIRAGLRPLPRRWPARRSEPSHQQRSLRLFAVEQDHPEPELPDYSLSCKCDRNCLSSRR